MLKHWTTNGWPFLIHSTCCLLIPLQFIVARFKTHRVSCQSESIDTSPVVILALKIVKILTFSWESKSTWTHYMYNSYGVTILCLVGLPFTHQFFSNGCFSYGAINMVASNVARSLQLLHVHLSHTCQITERMLTFQNQARRSTRKFLIYSAYNRFVCKHTHTHTHTHMSISKTPNLFRKNLQFFHNNFGSFKYRM